MVDEIEAEVQARVYYKMKEILAAVSEMANNNWHKAFQEGKPKYMNYWEAYLLMVNCFNKEIKTPLPSKNMALDYKKKAKGEVLDDIIKKLNTFGFLHGNEEGRVRRFLIKVIDKLQN